MTIQQLKEMIEIALLFGADPATKVIVNDVKGNTFEIANACMANEQHIKELNEMMETPSEDYFVIETD